MTAINYDHPDSLESLVGQIAIVKLKIGQVRRRRVKDYSDRDVPVPAGVAIWHLNMLDLLAKNLELPNDLDLLLEPVPGDPGKFNYIGPNFDDQNVENRGTRMFRSLFETTILLEEMIGHINKLFDSADMLVHAQGQNCEAIRRAEEARDFGAAERAALGGRG